MVDRDDATADRYRGFSLVEKRAFIRPISPKLFDPLLNNGKCGPVSISPSSNGPFGPDLRHQPGLMGMGL
jgi:hypothetical protein